MGKMICDMEKNKVENPKLAVSGERSIVVFIFLFFLKKDLFIDLRESTWGGTEQEVEK